MDFPPEVAAALEKLTNDLSNASPEAKAIIEQLQRGEMDAVTGIQALMRLMDDHPELVTQTEGFAMTAFAPTRDLSEMVQSGDLAIMQPPDGTGLPRLNPLYEGALVERVQFDGDVPELRSGPLPSDATPAVPVDTDARNPVAVGMMLNQASEEVQEELNAARQDAVGDALGLADTLVAGEPYRELNRVGGPDEVVIFNDDGTVEDTSRPMGSLSPAEQIALQEDQRFLALIDKKILAAEPEGYKTGQVPALRTVEKPSGSALAALTPEERREAAWRFLSTTQGRRTALRAITELVATGLASEGFEVAPSNEASRTTEVPVYAEWSVNLSGEGGIQPSFSFIDVAAKALLRKLVTGLEGLSEPIKNPVLEVIPINTVEIRSVGWAARIIEGGQEA